MVGRTEESCPQELRGELEMNSDDHARASVDMAETTRPDPKEGSEASSAALTENASTVSDYEKIACEARDSLQAAIEAENVDGMRGQLARLGAMIDEGRLAYQELARLKIAKPIRVLMTDPPAGDKEIQQVATRIGRKPRRKQ